MTLEAALAAIPTLLVIWAILTACFVALLTYRGTLTRYEDDQLFLNENEATASGERRQNEIVRRIRQVEPLVRIFAAAASLMTVGIVGIWLADAIRVLR
jgi:hypothetical protein